MQADMQFKHKKCDTSCINLIFFKNRHFYIINFMNDNIYRNILEILDKIFQYFSCHHFEIKRILVYN